ncbi:hypothetical protein pb186bvf_005070 [Paramecium bursaria]
MNSYIFKGREKLCEEIHYLVIRYNIKKTNILLIVIILYQMEYFYRQY